MHETAINSMIIYPIPLDFRFVIDNSKYTDSCCLIHNSVIYNSHGHQ